MVDTPYSLHVARLFSAELTSRRFKGGAVVKNLPAIQET